MGINEVGLAVMNTAMPSLETDPGYGNLLLNQKILETCESVDEVARRLADSQDPIGPNHRSELGTVATCVGVVDRFGDGAFFEVSNSRAYVEYVVDGYSTRANTPLVYGGGQREPSGRALYLRDALDDIYSQHGMIDWKDVMHCVSRCVRDKEQRSTPFSIDGEACNTNTVGAMVAVSGDSRYGGRLNCMWGACGPNPLVGVFLPAMVHIGEQPSVQATLWSETIEKWTSAQTSEPGEPVLLDPYRVREIQRVAFYTENYTCFEYDHLMSTIEDGLTDEQLELVLGELINRTVNYAAAVYVSENTTLSIPERTEYEFPEPTPTGTTTATHPSSTTTPISTSESLTTNDVGDSIGLGAAVQLGIGFAVGLAVVVVLAKRVLS
jgi:hypothetical protein